MQNRQFHCLNRMVSEVGIGTWQLGGTEWGEMSKQLALETLAAAAEQGVSLIDTADIYGLGRSELLVGEFLKTRSDASQFTVITKFGRGPEPGWPENFTSSTVRKHAEDSLTRLGVESLDLTQTHCLPSEYLVDGVVWETLRQIKKEGKIKAFGASVESMEEANDCLEIEGLDSIQIIFNVFRQKPLESLFQKALEKKVSLIVRLPLASGLLSGKFNAETRFDEKDHRSFNENGECFNVGETFAGLGLAKGAELAQQVRQLLPLEGTMAQAAIRWCLDFPAVTTVIPGATRPEQACQNALSSQLAPLSQHVHDQLRAFYLEKVNPFIRGKY